MKTTLLLLTMNEIDGMKAVMPKIDPSWIDQILVLDGGSTDGTVEWARENGYTVYVQKQKGIRFAYLESLDLIEGDYVISFSPDGNCPPHFIPEIIKKMEENHDLVIGSRYKGEAVSDDDDMVTAVGNWIFTKTVNILHGGSYTDAMNIYRGFRRKLIYELDLHKEASYLLPERLFFTRISWEPLMSVRAAKCGKKITELAVGEPARIGGERKLQIFRWGGAYYFQFFRELWYWRNRC